VTQPTLRLTATGKDADTGTNTKLRETTPSEQTAVVRRFSAFMRKPPSDIRGNQLRVLDFSPIDLPTAGLFIDLGIGVHVTRLVESAVAGELLRERDPDAEVFECTLDRLLSESDQPFDIVHTSLMLGARRELPLMTGLTQLGRLASFGFVWTDRVRQTVPVKAKRVRDLAGRVDLGFCAHKKPIGSPIFTLAGWRPSL